MLSHHN